MTSYIFYGYLVYKIYEYSDMINYALYIGKNLYNTCDWIYNKTMTKKDDKHDDKHNDKYVGWILIDDE